MPTLLFSVATSMMQRAPVAGGPRAAVIRKLFPTTQGFSWPEIFRVPFSQKKVAAIRWRIAQSRDVVGRAKREIDALEARSERRNRADQESDVGVARSARIADLRREAGVAESRVILLKARLRDMGVPSRNNLLGDMQRFVETFLASEERSARVLLSQLAKARDPWDLVYEDTVSLLRLGTQPELLVGFAGLRDAPRLAPHAVAIAARAAKLERYAPGIMVAVDGHLDAIEPHLDDILERLDEIEPHLPFVLRHIDVLAPHCGPLIKHLDALLLYADDGGKYREPLLPYVARFAPLLDELGPHLALARPHMSRLLPYMPVIAPSAHLYSKKLIISANADVLLFYFGWLLRVPRLGPWLLRLPFMPRLAAWLCRRLPHRPVRGRTCDYICDWEGCDVEAFSTEMYAAAATAWGENNLDCSGIWSDGYERTRQRIRGTSALLRRVRAA